MAREKMPRPPASTADSPEDPVFSGVDALRNEESVKRISGILLRIALSRARGKPNARHDAEDLVQDTLLRALAFAEHSPIEKGHSLLPWLITIMTNRSIDIARVQKARAWATEPVDVTSVEIEPYVAVRPSADAVLELRDAEKAIAELDPHHKEVLTLFLEDLSYKEIAEELGIPIGTVMSRLAGARRKMRERMGRGS